MAMEMTPTPVCRMFSAASDSEGDHTCYHSDSTGIEPDFSADRSHTARNPKLADEAKQESLSRRAARTRVIPVSEQRERNPWARQEMVRKTGGWTVMGQATH